MSTAGSPLLITSPSAELARMGVALGADVIVAPELPDGDIWENAGVLEAWRAEHVHEPKVRGVVVAIWPRQHVNMPLLDMDAAEFARRAEWPFAAWFAALGLAATRCADGGAIVALVERPSPLDCAGWSTESGTADAVEAFVRSLARSEGPRNVRVNAVTTPVRLAPAHPVAPQPPLPGFPGQVDDEVTNAVAMLLGPGVSGVTGTVVNADCGRSWR